MGKHKEHSYQHGHEHLESEWFQQSFEPSKCMSGHEPPDDSLQHGMGGRPMHQKPTPIKVNSKDCIKYKQSQYIVQIL